MTQNTNPPRRLSPWNPLDHLRLLWWVLVTPQRLATYREAFGENAEHSVTNWLISTIVWLLPFIPILALGLEELPSVDENSSSSSYLWLSAGLVLLWVLTGWPAKFRSRSTILIFAGFTATSTVVHMIASRLVGNVAGFVMAIVLMAIDDFLPRSIENSLRTGRPSRLARWVFIALLLVYAFLIWFSFLNGWRAFR